MGILFSNHNNPTLIIRPIELKDLNEQYLDLLSNLYEKMNYDSYSFSQIEEFLFS